MPGITDPSEEYFKDGLWAWVTDQWKKLVADASNFLKINIAAQDVDVEVKQRTAADLTPGVMGWDGAAWHKLPLMWGYYDTYSESQSAIDVAAGSVTVSFGVVPAGEIWIVQHFAMRGNQANYSRLELRAVVNAITIILESMTTPTAYQTIHSHYDVVLKEGDQLRGFAVGASLNDDFYAYACGYKMKVAE